MSPERLNQSKEIGNLINLTLSHYTSRHIRLLNTANNSRRERKTEEKSRIHFYFPTLYVLESLNVLQGIQHI